MARRGDSSKEDAVFCREAAFGVELLSNIRDSRQEEYGEREQNCQNEQEALDVTYSCARLQDKVSVIWEIRPVEPPKKRSYNSEEDNTLPRVPIRLVCVVDISHSMAEPYGPDEHLTKLDKIKMFAQLLVQAISEDDFLGIVTFGTKASVALPLTKMTPEDKENAKKTIDDIELGGVTNLGAGLITAVDQFKTMFTNSRFFHDCILLFTDGMANEGITETDEMIREIQKKIAFVREECQFEKDYTMKLVTMGTGGFLPELLYDIGQAFSSDSFFFLDETVNLELNLMKPVVLRQIALVSCLNIKVTALNGVLLDREAMSREYEPVDPDKEDNDPRSPTCVEYFIYDIPVDTQKHLPCYLRLPKKHKKALKDKDVLQIEIEYRDSKMNKRTLEKIVNYTELPRKEKLTLEKDILFTAQHVIRIMTQNILNRCAECMKRLDRTGAKETVVTGAEDIRSYCDVIAALLTEEAQEALLHFVEPIIVNLEYVDRFLGEYSVRWDDAWARLKAMSSSIGREAPTASGVYAEGAELFAPPRIDNEMDDLAARLRDLYVSRGMCTDSIDSYRQVIHELQRKLREQAEAEAVPEDDLLPSALKYITPEEIKEMQGIHEIKETRI